MFIATSSAVEDVTLTSVTKTKSVAPTAIIEIVGYSGIASIGTDVVALVFADGATQNLILRGVYSKNSQSDSAVSSITPKGNKFTGLTSVSRGIGNFKITLKITPISELNSVASGVVPL